MEVIPDQLGEESESARGVEPLRAEGECLGVSATGRQTPEQDRVHDPELRLSLSLLPRAHGYPTPHLGLDHLGWQSCFPTEESKGPRTSSQDTSHLHQSASLDSAMSSFALLHEHAAYRRSGCGCTGRPNSCDSVRSPLKPRQKIVFVVRSSPHAHTARLRLFIVQPWRAELRFFRKDLWEQEEEQLRRWRSQTPHHHRRRR